MDNVVDNVPLRIKTSQPSSPTIGLNLYFTNHSQYNLSERELSNTCLAHKTHEEVGSSSQGVKFSVQQNLTALPLTYPAASWTRDKVLPPVFHWGPGGASGFLPHPTQSWHPSLSSTLPRSTNLSGRRHSSNGSNFSCFVQCVCAHVQEWQLFQSVHVELSLNQKFLC